MNIVYLSVGGNLGDRKSNHDRLLKLIERDIGKILAVSAIYESEPWGFDSEHKFWNRVVKISTEKSASKVLKNVLTIEKMFGRTREKVRYSSREMDLDILYYNDCIIDTENLTIPHPRLHQRMFVLVPLVEIAPNFIHPVIKEDTIYLIDHCNDESVIKKISD